LDEKKKRVYGGKKKTKDSCKKKRGTQREDGSPETKQKQRKGMKKRTMQTGGGGRSRDSLLRVGRFGWKISGETTRGGDTKKGGTPVEFWGHRRSGRRKLIGRGWGSLLS